MVTGAEPAFFYDWDGEHVAVPSAGLLERSRRLLRKTTVATRCPTTVLRRLCENMMANSMSRTAVCWVGLYASLRGTSSLKRVGLHRLEAGEVARIVRVPHGEIVPWRERRVAANRSFVRAEEAPGRPPSGQLRPG